MSDRLRREVERLRRGAPRREDAERERQFREARAAIDALEVELIAHGDEWEFEEQQHLKRGQDASLARWIVVYRHSPEVMERVAACEASFAPVLEAVRSEGGGGA